MYHGGKHHSHLPMILAKLGGASFIVCFFWQFALPLDLQEFHHLFMSMSVIGFTGFNLMSFAFGVVQWAVWGWLVGMYVGWVKHYLWKHCKVCQAEKGKKDLGSPFSPVEPKA